MKYYIKERHNPQLGVCYTPLGRISKKEAKKCEQSLYGLNIILEYDTEEEYLKALSSLRESRKVVN